MIFSKGVCKHMMEKSKLKKISKLFFVFLRIGAFTFGGGYAMIPFIQREIVDNNHWIEEEYIVDIFAIVQSVPGVIAVNSAIFVGYRVAGLGGAIASTLGVVIPSFVIISIIALFFSKFKDLPVVADAFRGISAGVVALIVLAVLKLSKPSIKDAYGWIISCCAFLVVTVTDISAIYVLLVAAGLGLFIRYVIRRKES
jgi:chromate transporter